MNIITGINMRIANINTRIRTRTSITMTMALTNINITRHHILNNLGCNIIEKRFRYLWLLKIVLWNWWRCWCVLDQLGTRTRGHWDWYWNLRLRLSEGWRRGVGQGYAINAVYFGTLDIPVLVDFGSLVGIFTQQHTKPTTEPPILYPIKRIANFLPIDKLLMHIQIIPKIHIQKL